MSLTGRHRGKDMTAEELAQEAKAKGHRSDESLQGSEEQIGQNKPIANENMGHLERGHQQGFGKNQGKEGRDRSTAHGTRAPGAEHG